MSIATNLHNRAFLFFYPFLLSLVLIAFGVMLAIVPLSQEWKNDLLYFLQEEGLLVFILGLGFVLMGLIVLFHLYTRDKRRALKFQTNNFARVIDQEIVEGYLNRYWKKLFPKENVTSRVKIRDQIIYIFADLPKVEKPEEKILLEHIEKDLAEQFHSKLGYENPLYFNISFNQ